MTQNFQNDFTAPTDQTMRISSFGTLILTIYFAAFAIDAQTTPTLAPGAPGLDTQWMSAGKQAVGTANNSESKIWFTLEGGALTEVFYPTVDTPNVRLLQFVVVNSKTKNVETEREALLKGLVVNGNLSRMPRRLGRLMQENWTEFNFSKTEQPVDALYFNQFAFSENSNWGIIKSYITDPKSNTVMMRIRFQDFDKNCRLYVYYDPSLANSGMRDTAWNDGEALLAQDKDVSSALIASAPLSEISSGFYGTSDGLDQLKSSSKIVMPYARAENGNVVQMAKVNFEPNKPIDFALSFGKTPDEALKTAKTSLAKGFDKTLAQYTGEWKNYAKTLPKVEAKYQTQFNMAAMVLKTHEDKTFSGASVAALANPWGGGNNSNETTSGYHLVWSRDLYQVATAFMALGDRAAAIRALEYLFKYQQKPDGSFPQISWLDGRTVGDAIQMDEVSYPLILAYQLGKTDRQTYEKNIKISADYIVKNGPKSQQERWEEKAGFSPSTIAAEIAGLVCAAEIAKLNGDETSAQTYLKTADDWARNVEKWTATTTGKYGDGNYYLRLSKNGTPDAGDKIDLDVTYDEREIVDAGFLELVRLGIKSPNDPLIVKSLKIIDEQIKVNTPRGEAWYRYNHDGYGETYDGKRWNWDGNYKGKGHLWALLSGERGQYELALHRADLDAYNNRFRRRTNDSETKKTPSKPSIEYLAKAQSRLAAMSKFANDGLMIPEQIWDKPTVPDADLQFMPPLKFGEGNGSATPLAWSMAQFIRLAVNLQAGKNLDTPEVVAKRYGNFVR